MKKQIIYTGLLILLVTGCHCENTKSFEVRGGEIKITNWNVQTFFDTTTDGSEYRDFKNNSKWTVQKYETRLQNLVQAMKKIDSDIFVFEEVENKNVVQDIANFLAGEWNSKRKYKYTFFEKEKSSAIGLCIFSRFPLRSPKVHSMDIKSLSNKMPSSRPIVEITADINGKPLTLFINHWKSMSGGKEETEVWRNIQEGTLYTALNSLNNSDAQRSYLIAGDFNRDILDFYTREKPYVCIRECVHGDFTNNSLKVKSLWYLDEAVSENDEAPAAPQKFLQGQKALVSSQEFLASGTSLVSSQKFLATDETPSSSKPAGTYSYKGEWSKIDNFFCSENICVEKFYIETNGDWYNSTKDEPNRFALWQDSNFGYSDHLPISCEIYFE